MGCGSHTVSRLQLPHRSQWGPVQRGLLPLLLLPGCPILVDDCSMHPLAATAVAAVSSDKPVTAKAKDALKRDGTVASAPVYTAPVPLSHETFGWPEACCSIQETLCAERHAHDLYVCMYVYMTTQGRGCVVVYTYMPTYVGTYAGRVPLMLCRSIYDNTAVPEDTDCTLKRPNPLKARAGCDRAVRAVTTKLCYHTAPLPTPRPGDHTSNRGRRTTLAVHPDRCRGITRQSQSTALLGIASVPQ